MHDCLAKDPNDRPQNAIELIDRLSTIAFSEPWTPERAERWWRLHLPDRVASTPVADLESAPGVSDLQLAGPLESTKP